MSSTPGIHSRVDKEHFLLGALSLPWHTSYQRRLSKARRGIRIEIESLESDWLPQAYSLNFIYFFYRMKKMLSNLQRYNELNVTVHIILNKYMQCFV